MLALVFIRDSRKSIDADNHSRCHVPKKGTNGKICLLSDNLNTVFHGQQWGRQAYLFSLARHWSEITGKERALHSMPAFFRRNVLWVYVHSSIWMQHMQLVKPELLAQINTFLQKEQQVEDLRWMVQPTGLIDTPKEKYVTPEINVDPVAENNFRAMAENIPDPATREAFCKMWQSLMTANENKSR